MEQNECFALSLLWLGELPSLRCYLIRLHTTCDCRGLLWTAPELLRMEVKPRNGQPKGDVYAFGVILQEIVYRVMPYFIEDLDPKGVLIVNPFSDTGSQRYVDPTE